MQKKFGTLPGGEEVTIYTLKRGKLTAQVTDLGATLVSLWVPDREGKLSDVVLGFDDIHSYIRSTAFLGATVGRNANRVGGATFLLNGVRIRMDCNENKNNLHSGFSFYKDRLWQVAHRDESSITFLLVSPRGDQGFPGNAQIRVTYALEAEDTLAIRYWALCDQDTVFNMTNHSYFNLAGQERQELAMGQILSMPARFFTVADAQSIPTGENRSVVGTPMDFRTPKPLGQDIGCDYEPLRLQGGIDHNFEVFCNPCATLYDPVSGRAMAVSTDCPGIQVYSGNFTDEIGKGGIHYQPRCAVALETQYYPDSMNHPDWPQPITKAGQAYESETKYRFFVMD